jgi:hypothetical protein
VIDVMTRTKIHHLSEAGVLQAEVAVRCSVGLRTVQRVLTETVPNLTELTSGQVSPARRQGRPPKADGAMVERIKLLLESDPKVPAIEVLRRARESGLWDPETLAGRDPENLAVSRLVQCVIGLRSEATPRQANGWGARCKESGLPAQLTACTTKMTERRSICVRLALGPTTRRRVPTRSLAAARPKGRPDRDVRGNRGTDRRRPTP